MKKSLLSAFPEIASKWSNLNEVSSSEVAPFSHVIGIWDCYKGHSWKAEVATVTVQNQGCAVCSGRQVAVGYNDLLSQRPDVAVDWDYDKNGSLRPENVIFGTHQKVWWLCNKEGHSWETQVFARTNGGNNCPYCSGKKILSGYNDFAFKSPSMLREWDYSKNVIDPTTIGFASHSKVWWLCAKNNHSYQALVKSRTLRNHGCPICINKVTLIGFNDIGTMHPHLISEWNFDKNTILPTQVTGGYSKKVWWKCEKNHEWFISPQQRTLSKTRCPHCVSYATSQIEKDFRLAVAANPAFVNVAPGNVNIPIPGKPRGLNVDILCELAGTGQKLVIEYDGSYWHGENSPAKNVKERDLASTKLLLDYGYLVVRIREEPLKPMKIDSNALFQIWFKPTLSKKRFEIVKTVTVLTDKLNNAKNLEQK